MPEQKDRPLPLLFRDDNHSEDGFSEENEEFVTETESNFHGTLRSGLPPSAVAAISAALLACGLLKEGSIITAIRPVHRISPWKLAGIMELMAGRELMRL